jgi:Rieske 2Fe-2S family protein
MTFADTMRARFAEREMGYSLPQSFYVDPAVHDFEIQAIFQTHWIQAGLESEIPDPGDYLTITIGPSPIVILRNQDREIGGFFNTCRHRGAQICREQRGHAHRLVCPYHQWTYDLRGKLLQVDRMHEGFDIRRYQLRPVRTETVAGVIFVCLADKPPDFAAFRAALEPMLEPHDLRNTKVAHTVTLIERANWKLVMENARECYHCRAGHPQLLRSYNDFTAPDITGRTQARLAAFEARCESRGLKNGSVVGPWFEVGRFPLAEGVVSYTMDGKPAVAKKLGRVGDGDVGVMWWAIQPNGFNHVVGDYAFFFQALPTGPQETTVTGKWIVHKDAVEGVDYDLARLIEVWSATNDQDRSLVENNQRGVNSSGYLPGPYSQITEQLLLRFLNWYCAASEAFIASAQQSKRPSPAVLQPS